MTDTRERRLGAGAAAIVSLLSVVLAAPLAAQDLPRRGDATCSGDLTAADLVAALRGVGGDSICDADDCDRDGAVTAADVTCAAGCLFGICPVPAHAPRLTGVAADSAPEVVPGSLVRVAVANLGALDANKRVTVEGLEAEVIEQSEDELLVVLPVDLPVGPVELVVVDGDLAGPPITVEIAPPVPLGAPDTLEGLLGLVDAALAGLLELDVEAAFGDNAPLIRQEYARTRQELAAQRAALATDPGLDEAARIALDAAVDASGAAEELRALLAELEGGVALAGIGGPAQIGIVRTFERGARTIKIVGGVVRAAGTAAAATTTTIGTAPILAAIAAGLAINAGAVLVGSNPLTPLITGIDYLDADGAAQPYPTAGGIAVIRGHNFDTLTTQLWLRVAGGTHVGSNPTALGDAISYRLPAAHSFCGKVTVTLVRGSFTSNPVPQVIQPELLTLDASAEPGVLAYGTSRGLGDCQSPTAAFFAGVAPASSKAASAGVSRQGVTAVIVPDVLPGDYQVTLTVAGLASRPQPMTVRNPLSGLLLTCVDQILLPDTGAPPFVPTCDVVLQPYLSLQPQPSTFRWESSHDSVVRVIGEATAPRGSLVARNIGTANISVTLEAIAGPIRTLASSNVEVVTVVDQARPRISIASSATSPVQPGATIPVTITASDNSRLLTVALTATGDAVASGGDQEVLDCVGRRTCTTTLDVGLKASDFSQPTVTITASARDAGGNTAGSNTLTFAIARDTSCPTVTIQQPAAGGTVNAGETTLVVATASDSGPNDSGVTSFIYSASGPALVAPVAQTLPLPQPQANPTLRFNFAVKQPSELTEVEDKTIVISVEARDAAQPPNSCGAQTISVGVIGVLDRCNGGITTDNPAGYIGEAFTITVALTGAGADEITRVTSINPGGQFDLQSQGGGVYSVTLFYQGTGGFTLRFIAFDAAGEERCAGSIGLESLGPRPDAGVAAQQRGGEPAGGRMR